MKSIKKILYTVVVVIAYISCSNDSLSKEDFSTNLKASLEIENDITLAKEVMEVLNNHRASIGLNPIAWYSECEELAVEHSSYMVKNNKASHDNFYERSQILKRKGASFVSENVAYGYQDALSVLQAWLDSPSHKITIEGDYTHSGIGIVYTDNGIPYYTQLFIR
ncbi:CAP domain-containing protein [Dokdonia sp. Hel_I_53]|uniref:CAP domain-containing protein n=1 Tax=Dokdonia sp. Hel_I_53 TaxID=1566287 RepID=UPI00119BB024|nr:CAP domain-containing protein [Dokdonia sp. Hel_I_53]TVZ52713.1 Cysteine-rich secretory protein family protein [Dokdonia sp. Hel_I_53]